MLAVGGPLANPLKCVHREGGHAFTEQPPVPYEAGFKLPIGLVTNGYSIEHSPGLTCPTEVRLPAVGDPHSGCRVRPA